EIEAVLRQLPDIKDCVAIVREDVPGDKRLVAYVVLQSGGHFQAVQLRDHAKSKLPDYMVPSGFVPLENLPLTPNGKVDRKALPVPQVIAPPKASVAAPTSPLQQNIAKTSAEVLGVSQIGVHDNFFELGGNSLLATQLIARLRENLNLELPLRLAFEFP